MNTPLTPLSAAVALALLAPLAGHAQERGRVISSTPVMQTVAIPREVCSDRTITESSPSTGAGALLGGIAGGAAGNAIGDGGGRAAATAIGIIGGAMLGNKIEGGGQTQTRVVRQCSTQTVYEDRAAAYDVVYEYAGRQYSVRLAEDPGAFVELQLNPVGALPEPAPNYAPQYVQPYTAPYPPQYVPQYTAPQYVPPPVTRIIVSPDYYYVPPPRVYYTPPVYRPRPDRDYRNDRRDDRRDDRRGDHRDDRRDDRPQAGRDDRRDNPPAIGRPVPRPPSSRTPHPGDQRQPGDFP